MKLAALKFLILVATLVEVGCEAEYQQRQPSNTPLAYAQTGALRPRRSYTDFQFYQCVGDLALQRYRGLGDNYRYRTAWLKSMYPLLDQFSFTPWAEIPKIAQDQIRARRGDLRLKERAKEAIRLKVPVSQMRSGCKPKYPHCFDISHPDNQDELGHLYVLVLLDALGLYSDASSDSKGEDIHVTLTTPAPGLSSSDVSGLVVKAIVDEDQKALEVSNRFKAFHELLPDSAVTPNMRWAEVAPHPISCQGIIEEPK